MLRSILHGKSRRAEGVNGISQSVGALFRNLEDARTSTIFERLTYFPPVIAWDLLRLSSKNAVPDFRLVELAEVKFWPKWQIARSGRKFVEPDVYMRWVVGDPSIIIDMIIEAKLPGAISQSPQQWLDQLEGYRDHFHAPEDSSINETDAAKTGVAQTVIHLSVDGLGSDPQSRQKLLVPTVVTKGLPAVRFVACSWQSLAEALDELGRLGRLEHVPNPLVEDLRKAFDYCGHYTFRISKSLFTQYLEIDFEDTISALNKWVLTS